MPHLSHLTSCTPTKSNLYLANSLATAVSEPALYRLPTFHAPKTMSLFRCLLRGTSSRNTPLRRYERGSSLPVEASCLVFLNVGFHREALLAACPTPKLEDHLLSAVCDCLFNLFTATLHIGRSSLMWRLTGYCQE